MCFVIIIITITNNLFIILQCFDITSKYNYTYNITSYNVTIIDKLL